MCHGRGGVGVSELLLACSRGEISSSEVTRVIPWLVTCLPSVRRDKYGVNDVTCQIESGAGSGSFFWKVTAVHSTQSITR
jgi:hypothetical protein